MATPKYRAQINLARRSGLAEDVVVNVMHFEGDDDPAVPDREHWDGLASGLSSRLVTFYQAIDAHLSISLATSGHVVRLYDMDDPKPRIPRVETAFTMSTGTTALPSEVALCLSMAGQRISGMAQARRRGRIYLGPFATATATTGQTAGDNRPSTTAIGEILDAAKVMATGINGAARLAIYSPTTTRGGGSADEAWTDALTLYIDDAWDTQRRRGAAPTTRITRTI